MPWLCYMYSGMNPGTHSVQDFVSPRAGLDVSVKSHLLQPDSNPRLSGP